MNTHFLKTKTTSTETNGSTPRLSSSISSKKKFGKNLSKLIKQPSPPQISGLNSKSIYRSTLNTGTSNLVLLSTKKKKNTTNGLLRSSSSVITGGAISGAIANGMNSNIVNETEGGDNLNDLNSNKTDAWGMDKAKQNQLEEEQNQYQSVAKEKEDKPYNDYVNINIDSKEQIHNQSSPDKSNNEEANNNTLDPVKHNQVEFMKQLAKEKAEKIRQEEENRFQQQKERAAMRLKELEMKMAQKSSNDQQQLQRQQQQQLQSKRTLFDPSSSTSRTYSTFVGNGDISARSNSGPGNSLNVSEKDMSKPLVQHDSHIYQRQHNPPPQSDTPTMPMFHLSSYEDRDRGMVRNLNAGPRMLFDPKSGSMIAAPTKNDITTGNVDRNSSGNDDRERSGSSKGKREKGKQKGSRNSRRDLDSGGASTVDSDGLEEKGNKLKSKKKEKDKRKEDKKDSTSSPDSRRRNNTAAADERNGVNHIKKVKLPRTNGVLYKRDKNGKLVSADGCEGDQGYGSHSVPGGRIRNPKAYATHKRKLQNESKLFPSYYFDDHGIQGMGTWNHHYDYAGSFMNMDYDSTRTKTLDRSHFMRKNNSSNQPPNLKEEVNLDLPFPFRVKGDEKLELLTGMDESPTLQATAAEWAPSEAALALAAANARKKSSEIAPQKIDSLTESEAAIGAMVLADDGTNDDDHDDEEGNDGLGFDPTKDMDAVMMSPDFFSTDISDSDKDIPDLLFNRISSKNPFASDILLGPSPWGTNKVHNSASMGALSDWAFLTGNGKKDGANNELSSENAINDDIMRANSVLSLSGLHGDGNTWGTGGLGTKFNAIDGKSFSNDNTTASPR